MKTLFWSLLLSLSTLSFAAAEEGWLDEHRFFSIGPNTSLRDAFQEATPKNSKAIAHLPVRAGLSPEDAVKILKQSFPDLRIEVAPPREGMWVEGPPAAMEQLRELLSEP